MHFGYNNPKAVYHMDGMQLMDVSDEKDHSVNSSSHSVNGDIAIQWEWSNFDPHRIKTP